MAIKYVHKSDVGTIRNCSQQFYYERVLKAKPEFDNERGLAGVAYHRFCQEIYLSKKPDKWNDYAYWCKFFLDELARCKEECITNEIDIISPKDLEVEKYLEMIVEFLKQDFNRTAIPILLETTFRFCIKIRSEEVWGFKEYWFEGTIDQLLQIETKYIFDFQIPFMTNELSDKLRSQSHVYIHRDIKTGDRKIMSELTLLTNEDILFYSYGLAFGLFNTRNDWATAQPINRDGPFIPFAHALYYTRDHLKYKRASGDKVKGDYRGQGMYFIRKDLDDLKHMEDQLILWHRRVNSELYTRDAAGTVLCDVYCQHNKKCLHELKTGR